MRKGFSAPLGLWLAGALAVWMSPATADSIAPVLHESPLFRKFGVVDGLPSSSIHALAQDRAGYIWIATVDGLARYDGVGFKIFRHDPNDATSIAGNDITTIFVDRDDRVWCGVAAHGMDLLDTKRDGFAHFTHNEHDANSPSADDVWMIGQDATGAMLFGTGGSGLDRMSANGAFAHLRHDENDSRSLTSDKITALFTDDNGRLWVGSDYGLDVSRIDGGFDHVDFSDVRHDAGRVNVRKLLQDDDALLAATNRGLVRIDKTRKATIVASDALTHKAVFSLARDSSNALWIGTQRGLNRRRTDGTIESYIANDYLPGSLSGNLIPDILCDREGNVWFASDEGGLMQLPAQWRNFAQYRHDPGDAKSLSANRVQGLSVDARGGVWAVNLDGGIDRLDPATGRVERFADRLPAPSSKVLFATTIDRSGRLWLGHAAGARIYRLDTKSFDDLPIDPHRDDALAGGIVGFAETADAMWAATNGRGLHRIDLRSHRIARYDAESHGLRSVDINRIGLDPEGALLVASAEGIDRYDAAKNEFMPVAGLPDGNIIEFAFATDGSLWLLEDAALEHFCAPKRCGTYTRIARYSAAEGWPNATFTGMQVDVDGRVWASGPRGLWRYDPATSQLRQFGTQDGLISAEFNDAALVQRDDGTIFGATLAGVVGFDPRHIAENKTSPSLLLDRATIRRADREIALDTSAPIALRWNDRDLHFTARALSYVNPAGNRYQWRLADFDREWIGTGNRGEREFSQLPPGEYQFRWRAANASGIWSETSPVTIRVAPPPWLTSWAFAAYVLIGIAIASWSARAYRRRLERRHAYELAKRANAVKSEFLATMGHEIRTPMTGVLGMTELLMRTTLDRTQRDYANAIQNSGRVLLRLVNDSLDLARIEAGKLDLETAPFDLHALVREISALEQPLAERKGLRWDLRIASNVPRHVRGDAVRVQQIVVNLANNAIKFTECGEVALDLSRVASGSVQFDLRDSGPGISEETQRRLFQRFEQADGPQRRVGSGLGLAICRELVACMGGEIALDSKVGVGSTFRVTLPLSECAPHVETQISDTAARAGSLRILLVEDDAMVADVIAGLLQAQGHFVRHVGDGLAALAEISAEPFDAIFVDLDLPGIDGIALARLIRNREKQQQQSPVPIVAVTARSGGDEETRSLAAGMDAFLRKPVTGAMLAERLRAIMTTKANCATSTEETSCSRI